MGVDLRTEDLRKIYNSPPPMAAAGVMWAGPKSKGKKTKTEIVALDGLTLEINAGEIFGLLGPNGAGKSTTVGILTTRIKPTSGTAWIGKYDIWKEQVEAKRLIGVVQQRPNLDFTLTAREILLFHGRGRDASYPAPPAQTRAGALNAHGSYLGCGFRKFG